MTPIPVTTTLRLIQHFPRPGQNTATYCFAVFPFYCYLCFQASPAEIYFFTLYYQPVTGMYDPVELDFIGKGKKGDHFFCFLERFISLEHRKVKSQGDNSRLRHGFNKKHTGGDGTLGEMSLIKILVGAKSV